MGRGVALQAKERYPGIKQRLGSCLQRWGNRCFVLENGPPAIVSMPVKHNWWEKADLTLIEQSAHKLVEMADKRGWNRIVVPRPGCGNRKLRWWDVEPVLEHIFDNQFAVIWRG